jgi:hypothetical protein
MVVAGTAENIDILIREIPPEGVYPYSGLLNAARDKKFHGVAVSGVQHKKIYLLFINGEPEGAVLADSKGELYGNKAVYLTRGDDRFTLYPVNPEVIERIVFSCRIYDKSHFTTHYTLGIPELGKKAEGVGRAVIALKKDGFTLPGVPIRIRKDGQIVANDITDNKGLASFRLLYGTYEVIIVRQENNIDVFEFSFVPELQGQQLDLELS